MAGLCNFLKKALGKVSASRPLAAMSRWSPPSSRPRGSGRMALAAGRYALALAGRAGRVRKRSIKAGILNRDSERILEQIKCLYGRKFPEACCRKLDSAGNTAIGR